MSNLKKYQTKELLGAWGFWLVDIFESIACLIIGARYPNILGAIIILCALVLEVTISLHANDNDVISRHWGVFQIASLICAGLIIIGLLIMLFMVSPFHK